MNTILALALAGAVAAGPALAQPAPKAPPNANRPIWTLNVTQDRKEHALKGGYTKHFDLSGLPHYVPRHHLTGVLRIWGSNYFKDGPLGGYLAEEFKKFQPDVTIEYNLPTAGIAVPALAARVADIGVGRKATLMDLLTFEQVFHHTPVEIAGMTGSYDVYGWSPAFIILVNKANPITGVSMKQLDGVFGGARGGGYDGSTWRTDYPYKRGANEDIRNWGQLGLKGAWAHRPIHPVGQTFRANIMTVFSNIVLKGSDQWVEGFRTYANYATPQGRIYPWSYQVRDAVKTDPDAISVSSPLSVDPDLKELPVQAYPGGPYVKRTLESVRDHTYPLYNEIYFYFDREPGQAIDPKVEEFMRFILSQEGQEQVQREGRYLPLTAKMVQDQLKKLD